MMPKFSTDIDSVDWDRLASVFEQAPLGKREPATLELTFRNSQVRSFVYIAGEIVGAGRALTDWVAWTIVFDVVLLSEYQGLGYGKAVMGYLTEQANTKNVMLYFAPGKERFYAGLGFRHMKTAMAKFGDPDRAEGRGFV